MTSVFIASSGKGLRQAHALKRRLGPEFDAQVWDEGVFKPMEHPLETLLRVLDRSDFGVFLFTPDDVLQREDRPVVVARDNVVFELGLFMGRLGRERTFVVRSAALAHLLTDLQGITVVYGAREGAEEDELASAAERLAAAMRAVGPVRRPPTLRVKEPLCRGDVHHETVADGAIFVGERRYEYFDTLRRFVAGRQPVPTKYLYWTEQGSRLWLKMCREETYRYYRHALQLVEAEAPAIAHEAAEAAGSTAVDLVSLGSGDGLKDNALLGRLAERLPRGETLWYYPIDISDSLLVEASRNAVGGGLDRSRVSMKAVVGDFTRLPELKPVYEWRPNPNVFSILGNTLGNNDEAEILRTLRNSMFEGDFVLVEANVSRDVRVEDYKDEVTMRSDFTPLSALGLAFEETLLDHEVATGRSVVPGTRTVITRCKEAVLKGVERAETIELKDVQLSLVHHYDLDALQRTLERRLRVTTLHRAEKDGVGLLLARRTS